MIIPLIQALYDPHIPFPDDLDFYEKALEDIDYFSVWPQIYCLLRSRGKLAQTPLFFQERLKHKYDQILFSNLFIKSQTEQILRKFDDLGIPAIPLKGVHFAEKYFGHLGARGTSDIDLLVKQYDVQRAADCVKAIGFLSEQEQIPDHFHWSYSKKLPHSPVPLTVELHWDLLKKHTSEFKIDELWEQSPPLEPYRLIKELSDYHTFYMMCLHGWRHNMNSLKYFIDIIQLIHVIKEQIHYPLLMKDAAAHKTLRRITRTLKIVYHYFPHLDLIQSLPFQRVGRLWWDYQAMRTGKRSLIKYINWLYYPLFDYDTIKHRLGDPWGRMVKRLKNRQLANKKRNLQKVVDSKQG